MQNTELKMQNTEVLPDYRHTEDMQEIITRVPAWIVRWGITLFFGILLMVAGIGIVVRYPDTIKAAMKVESVGDVQSVTAGNGGRIMKVLVKPGGRVKKGDTLLLIADKLQRNTVLLATISQNGRVFYTTIAQHGYMLKPGEVVATVHPDGEQFFGLVRIPQGNIGKVRVGQLVLVRLNGNSAETSAPVRGTVSYIADEPVGGFFAVKVSLPLSGEIKGWMTGQAEIVTENVSLLSRVYKSIWKGL
ncbi:MAG: HlyD family efflux transporter periplasmic adaptor subunit [Mucilaginibacter sp.]